MELGSSPAWPARSSSRRRSRRHLCRVPRCQGLWSPGESECVPDDSEALGDRGVVDPGTPLVGGYQAGVSKQLQMMVALASRGFADAGGHVARADLVRVEQQRHDLHPGWVGARQTRSGRCRWPPRSGSRPASIVTPLPMVAFLTDAETSTAVISGMLNFTPLRSMAPNVGVKTTRPEGGQADDRSRRFVSRSRPWACCRRSRSRPLIRWRSRLVCASCRAGLRYTPGERGQTLCLLSFPR